MTNLVVNKNIEEKENFADNNFHNILRLFDVLPNLPFTQSKHGIYELPNDLDLGS